MSGLTSIHVAIWLYVLGGILLIIATILATNLRVIHFFKNISLRLFHFFKTIRLVRVPQKGVDTEKNADIADITMINPIIIIKK